MGVLTKQQVVLSNDLLVISNFAIVKLSLNSFVKQLFLIIPGFFVVNYTQITEKNLGFYIGIFDSSDFRRSMDLMSIMSTLLNSER